MCQWFLRPSLVEIGQGMSKLQVLEVLPEEERRRKKREGYKTLTVKPQGKEEETTSVNSSEHSRTLRLYFAKFDFPWAFV